MIEFNPAHCAVHEFNIPETTVIPTYVEDLTIDVIKIRTYLDDHTIDCVFGRAHCQSISLIGRRALNDPRNKLVLNIVRLVRDLDPTSLVFENVKGLTVGKHRKFLHGLMQTFNSVGYEFPVPWKVLNAYHFDTPQSREGGTNPRPVHYSYRRCISMYEMVRLHDFPDWFQFYQTKWHGAQQIGNSVSYHWQGRLHYSSRL